MSVYIVRSNTMRLAEVTAGAVDTLFINERFEDRSLPLGTYEHCTFANVSFKGTTLTESTFTACVFESCYFRRTTFDRCRFPASRFIDCDFVRPRISLSDFSYSRFTRCAPEYREFHASLPGEANLKADLASNVATQCEIIGQPVEARLFRITAREAREDDLWAAVIHENEYYKTHYDIPARIAAAWRLGLSRLNRWLWGYGERARILIQNLVLLTAALFPLLFALSSSDVQHNSKGLDYWGYLLLSGASLVNSAGVTGYTVTGVARVWVISETAVGFLVLGLYLTYLLRWISRR